MKLKVILVLAIGCVSCFSQSNRQNERNLGVEKSPAEQRKEACDFSAFKPFQVSHFVRSNLKKRFIPEYPQTAVQRNAQGIVSIKILVDRDGSVVKACALEGDDELAKVAEDAALKWQFNRKVVPGQKTYVEAGITFRFVLNNDGKYTANSEELIVRPKRIGDSQGLH